MRSSFVSHNAVDVDPVLLGNLPNENNFRAGDELASLPLQPKDRRLGHGDTLGQGGLAVADGEPDRLDLVAAKLDRSAAHEGNRSFNPKRIASIQSGSYAVNPHRIDEIRTIVDMAHDEPHHRLRKAREMAGYASAAAAAEAMGIKASTYTHHENGTREFSRQDATLYARKFKVRPAWLMFDEPEATGDRAKKIREVDIRAGAGGPGVESVALLETTNGVTLAADAVAATWEMPDSFLRGQLRINPERAWVVEVVGDSGYDPANPNAPGSLFPGDRAIIDTGDVRPSPAGHFAVFDGMGLVIKMVEVIAGSDPLRLRLVSRNPLYNPYEVTLDEAKVIGRVKGRISTM